MTREEFIMYLNCIEQSHNEEKLTCTISDEDYKTIEKVYTWHPAISDTHGKEEIAMLYYMAKMGLIMKMFGEALVVEKATLRIQNLKNELEKEEKLIHRVRELYGAFRVIKEKI